MRPLHALICAVWLSWLAACGPGTGGTGTGETQSLYLELFGARAASVCTSSFAGALSCSPTGVGSPPASAPPAGTLVSRFTDAAAGGEVHMVVEGNAVQLEARCQGLQFDGDWGIAGVDDARFYGGYATPTAPTPVAATLAVAAVPGAVDALQVTLRQADGRVLLGPVLLLRVAVAAAEPAVCR